MKNNLRKYYLLSLAWLVMVLLNIAPMMNAQAAKTHRSSIRNDGQLLDRVVGLVNDTAITQSELTQRMAMLQQSPIKASKSLRKLAIENLIDEHLFKQFVENNKYKVTDAELDQAINGLAAANKLSVKKFQAVVTAQTGLSFSQYRQQLAQQLLVNMIQQQLFGNEIQIQPQEITQLLAKTKLAKQHNNTAANSYHVLDILLTLPTNTTAEIRATVYKQAMQLSKLLKTGIEPKQAIAKLKLTGQQVILQDLEWRLLKELPDLFITTVQEMQVQQISQIIQADNGLHLLKLLAVRSNDQPVPQLTAQQAKELLYRQKMELKFREWLKKQRDTAYIAIY